MEIEEDMTLLMENDSTTIGDLDTYHLYLFKIPSLISARKILTTCSSNVNKSGHNIKPLNNEAIDSCFEDLNSSFDHNHLVIQGLVAKHFKLSSIHEWDMNAITSAVKGKDSFIVQPTGTGKSMCYVIPPLLTRKLAIVISLTISLMCDQVHKMEKHGVFATFLSSAQKHNISNNLQKYTHV
ncbi:PREDICTED: ATP-dependent DNA helicase Q-like SIM [Amphimedon queenslandica]|uniref:DEAD/DEAH-box helicase domain-containing protein n=1 Tax=Amphimedon queenslandica TaxID=400682 RepID=A0AAN0IN80_AMPQE|nr:PREDICTED: ATP-dependent DNA helicase Q-like SIM [Amphimedon queenslandica]|eukprot:XP_011405460.1 PREDICTED: ATP-dependent DNA helicase Q-like SIM [Amphimedon queenslandica]